MNKIVKNIFKVFILVLLVLGLYESNLNNSNTIINAETEENTEEEIEQEEYSEGLLFTLSKDGTYYSVSKGTCTDTEVIIPESYEGLPVKNINFSGDTTLISIIIPNSITFIEYNEFKNCTSLKNITIPSSVTSIGGSAFYNCTSLKNITIPGSVTSIGQSAFYNCKSLESVYYTGTIGDWCNIYIEAELANPMYYASNFYIRNNNEWIELNEINIPNNIKSIKSYIFVGFENVTSVIIPNSVTSIGYYAFYNCTSLTNITIPNSVTSIGNDAFYNCSSLENVYYEGIIEDWCKIEFLRSSANPMSFANHIYMLDSNNDYYELIELDITNTITTIGNFQFYGFKNITNIIIPSSVTSIGYNAFSNCTSLTNVTFAEGIKLQNIGSSLFYGCSALTSIIIPSSVTSIEGSTFSHCSSLTDITIPNSVTSIGNSAFTYCSSLVNITIPSSVTSIGSYAFENCSSLTNITIPSSVTSIGYNAFYYCSKLVNVYYEGTIEEWCKISFGSSSSNPMYYASHFYIKNIENSWGEITEIEISNSITSIDYQFCGFKNVATIIIPSSVTSIGNDAFYDCTSLTNITIPNSVTSIGSNAFSYCSSLTNITIPNSVTSIGSNAFYNCTSLTNVTFAEGIKLQNIGSSLFYGCSALTSIIIPSSVTSIGNSAFTDCSSLVNITIPSSVTSIGSNAFIYCSSLTNITIPSSVTSIESSTFSHCSSLTDITIPNSVTSIGYYAFYNCTSLTNITIPNSVTSIGSYAFENCSELENVYYEGTIEEWCKISFGSSSSNPMYYASHFYINNKEDEWNEVNEIKIPNTISKIGPAQFYGFKNVTSIIISSSITGIDNSAFSNCSSLTTVTFEEGSKLTSIGSNAFNNCIKLFEVINNSNLVFTPGSNNYGSIAYYALKVDNKGTVIYKDNAAVYEYITTEDGFKFLNHNNNYYLISYTGSDERPVLPATINGKTYKCQYMDSTLKDIELSSDFTNIPSSMFQECSLLESIVIPNTVTSIESSTFYRCTSLIDITIPNSVRSITGDGFSNCTSLTKVYYEGSIEDWCSLRFSYGHSNPMTSAKHFYVKNNNNEWEEITEIKIPNTITIIGLYQFFGFNNVTSVVIPSSVTGIDNSAFSNCSSLTTVTFEEGSKLTSIGNNAFTNCSALTSIIIPNSVRGIGSNAFSYCSSLTNIEIPNSVTNISNSAFYYCSSLENIIIPANVTSIGSNLFGMCSSLTSITIPSSVTSIGDSAFYYCSSLENIIIPNSVTSIKSGAFANCYSLENVYYEGTVGDWCKISFGSSTSNPMYYASRFYINNNESEWDEVNEILIPSTLTKIGAYQFYGFENVTSITIPSNVTSIGSSAFSGCTSLKSIINHSSYLSFNDYLSLKVKSDYGYLFKYVTEVIDYVSQTKHTLYDGYAIIETFSGFKFKYQDSKYTLIEYIGSNDTVTLPLTINGNTYDILNLKGIKHLIIPEGFTSISNQAFYGCDTLESVTIPSSLESIGDVAFSYCSNLKWVKIDSEVIASSIESNTSLGRLSEYPVTYIINNNITSIGTYILNNFTYINEDIYKGYTVYSKHSHDIASGNICKLDDNNVYCTECNIEFMNLKFNSMFVNLTEDINLTYRTTIPSGYTNFYMVFSMNGVDYRVDKYFTDENNRYCFTFPNIMPQNMGDNITARLYATVNEEEVYVEYDNYSIKRYCTNLLNKLEDNEANKVIRTLLSDLLEYGAAVQVYRNYKVDELVTKDLILNSSVFTELDETYKKQSLIGEASEEIKWKSVGLFLENTMSVRFGFTLDLKETDINDLTVVISINGRTTTYKVSELEVDETGVYRIFYRGVYAREFNDVIEAYFLKGDTQIGNTLQYSINTYIYNKQSSSDAALVAIIKAIYSYGASTEAYEKIK